MEATRRNNKGARRSNKTLLAEDDGADHLTLTVNEDFARRYELKKKKEEVSQAKEMVKQLEEELSDEDSEEDVEEDEVGMLDPLAEDQFLRILPLLAKKDRTLYDKNLTFFPTPSDPAKESVQQTPSTAKPFVLKGYVKGSVPKPALGEQRTGQSTREKEKPVHYKDYIRETLLKEGSEGLLESDDDESNAPQKELTHFEEQALLKKRFLEASSTLESSNKSDDEEADEDGGGFLKLRAKSAADKAKEQKEDLEFWKEEEKRTGKKLRDGDDILSSFWLSEELDDNEKFLRNYILNNGWIDKEKGSIPTYEQILKEDEEDEQALEQQEEFEVKHQEAVAFHYLEENGDQIVTHPRTIEDSARRKESKRTKKREKRKEKKQKERKQKEEELKRIKNLMKENLRKQLSKIQETGGTQELAFGEDYLEEEFDPAEHDRKMASMFNEDYYEGEAEEEAPTFRDEEENDRDFGLQKTVDSLLKSNVTREDEEKDSAHTGEEEKEEPKDKNADDLLEKYFSLNFEDLIAGEIPCRFKYRQVKPKSYGLDVDAILSLPDSELNRRVSLKKLAPYRHFNKNAKKRAARREKRKRQWHGEEEEQNAEWRGHSGSAKRRRGEDKTPEQTEEKGKWRDNEAKKTAPREGPSKKGKKSDAKKQKTSNGV